MSTSAAPMSVVPGQLQHWIISGNELYTTDGQPRRPSVALRSRLQEMTGPLAIGVRLPRDREVGSEHTGIWDNCDVLGGSVSLWAYNGSLHLVGTKLVLEPVRLSGRKSQLVVRSDYTVVVARSPIPSERPRFAALMRQV